MDEVVNIEEAARAMGKKGGAVRSEKKLAAAKRNIQKAAGGKKGKKYPGLYDQERLAAAKATSRIVDSNLTLMASILGRKGGSARSDKKTLSSRLNARGGIDGKGKRAGRPPKYKFTKQARALLGVRTRYSCLIPDEVAENPRKFLGKTFPAFYKKPDGKDCRAKARIVSIDKNKQEIILTHYFTRRQLKQS